MLPPAFAALNNEDALQVIGEMYEAMDQSTWTTCVVCWRAWYAVPREFQFMPCVGRHGLARPWYDYCRSGMLGCTRPKRWNRWCMQTREGDCGEDMARHVLSESRGPAAAEDAMKRIHQPERHRTATVCHECAVNIEDEEQGDAHQRRMYDDVVDPVYEIETEPGTGVFTSVERHEVGEAPATTLTDTQGSSTGHGRASLRQGVPHRQYIMGRPLADMASPIAALSDFEEMVLALVHPLVQVYTIPRTGQLAYVGHVCNFRQNVPKFIASLPVLPGDMPLVMVRPREFRGQPSSRPPFKIDVTKVRIAFEWLKRHNAYYRNIVWEASAEAAWRDESQQIGRCRDEDILEDEPAALTEDDFHRWIQEGQARHDGNYTPTRMLGKGPARPRVGGRAGGGWE